MAWSPAERRPDCEVYAWTVRDRLPAIPIPLAAPDEDVVVDLGAVFTTAYTRGRYARLIDYSTPPAALRKPNDRAWAEKIARRGAARSSVVGTYPRREPEASGEVPAPLHRDRIPCVNLATATAKERAHYTPLLSKKGGSATSLYTGESCACRPYNRNFVFAITPCRASCCACR